MNERIFLLPEVLFTAKKPNLFVRFLGESMACQSAFDFILPLHRQVDLPATYVKDNGEVPWFFLISPFHQFLIFMSF